MSKLIVNSGYALFGLGILLTFHWWVSIGSPFVLEVSTLVLWLWCSSMIHLVAQEDYWRVLISYFPFFFIIWVYLRLIWGSF